MKRKPITKESKTVPGKKFKDMMVGYCMIAFAFCRCARTPESSFECSWFV